jgi:hypothetical protein
VGHPVSLVVHGRFIVCQLYCFSCTHGFAPIVSTVFDVVPDDAGRALGSAAAQHCEG